MQPTEAAGFLQFESLKQTIIKAKNMENAKITMLVTSFKF